jgi:hypothetical protein
MTPEPRRYRKKPLSVIAMQWSEEAVFNDLVLFANYLIRVDSAGPIRYFVYDRLHDTWVEFKRGDWIVQGVKGEFYPVEEVVFAETYEQVGFDPEEW